MKKAIILLGAVFMLIAVMAACSGNGAATNPPAPTTNPTTAPTETVAPTETATETPANVFIGVLDMTEDYTMVIETPGTSGNERIGVRCELGKVQIGQYNKLGSKRTEFLEFNWADLGLPGEGYEYLGSTFEFDTSGSTPVLKNTPEKTLFVIPVAELKLEDDGVLLPNGKKIDYTVINDGVMRPKSLINEGGKYIMGWNDLSISKESFSSTTGYYVIAECPMYNQAIRCSTSLLPGEAIASEPDDPAGTFTGTMDMTADYTLVIETPGSSGDARIGVQAEAGMVSIGRYDKTGMERKGSLDVKWADLGLEGAAWEYLGAYMEFDTSGATPVLKNAPEKTTFICAFDKITVEADAVVLEDGKKITFAELNNGRMRANNLLNEGGKFACGWNDHSVDAEFFTNTEGYYVFTFCPKFDNAIVVSAAELPKE